MDTVVQSPAILDLGERLIVAGRSRRPDPSGARPHISRTALWELTAGTELAELLVLPSGGDTAYPGLAARDDGTVVVSYYSQHETAQNAPVGGGAAVYLACVRV